MIFVSTFFQALLAVSDLLASSSGTTGRPFRLDRVFPDLRDSKAQSLCQYQGQMILDVSTASFFGSARPYEGLTFVEDKYLIHRDGARVESCSSLTAPDSRALIAHIERWLAETP